MTTKDSVLALLQETQGFLSGQEMSRRLSVSRMAVNKAIDALRAAGYQIEAVTKRGYRLLAAPDHMTLCSVAGALGDHPWAQHLLVLDTVDSTNNLAKRMATDGAPAGTVIIANGQTSGRGCKGRSFYSPADCGIFLSCILRPDAAPAEILHMTALVAEAMVQAVEETVGIRPGIKWTNDLVCGGRKLCGILTELTVEAESGRVGSVIPGIGINCGQLPEDFPEELRDIATSLRQIVGHPVDRSRLAAAMIRNLALMDAQWKTGKAQWISRYAADCITVGKDVQVVRGDSVRNAHADGIDQDGALLVTYPDGTKEKVFSGQVSVRGMYGYV